MRHSTIKIPTYICKNRFGVYFFRIVVPQSLRLQIQRKSRDFKRSLRTRVKKEALRKANKWRIATQLFWLEFNSSHGQLQQRLTSREIASVDHQLIIDLQQIFKVQVPGQKLTEIKTNNTLSMYLEDYMSYQKTTNIWTLKSSGENFAAIKLFIRMVGDIDVNSISKHTINQYVDKLLKLPANINKLAVTKGKHIDEIINF